MGGIKNQLGEQDLVGALVDLLPVSPELSEKRESELSWDGVHTRKRHILGPRRRVLSRRDVNTEGEGK